MTTVNHEYYVSPEVAKLLKEAGFDWGCQYYIHAYTQEIVDSIKTHKKLYRNEDVDFSAPTLAVAQRWLREVKDKQVHVISYRDQKTGKLQGWCYKVYEMSQGWEFNYLTYEEAQEAGIKKALEIILEKGE